MSNAPVSERETTTGQGASVGHPLGPRSDREISETVDLLRKAGAAHDNARFITVTLQEPHKDALLERRVGESLERLAHAVPLDNASGEMHEALVSLTQAEVVQRVHIAGVQPATVLDEFFECKEAVKRHPGFQQALAKRGITDFDLLMADPWSAGNYGDERESRLRLARTLTWMRQAPAENGYAHPAEGLLAWVDFNTMEVVHLEDSGVVPLPLQV